MKQKCGRKFEAGEVTTDLRKPKLVRENGTSKMSASLDEMNRIDQQELQLLSKLTVKNHGVDPELTPSELVGSFELW